ARIIEIEPSEAARGEEHRSRFEPARGGAGWTAMQAYDQRRRRSGGLSSRICRLVKKGVDGAVNTGNLKTGWWRYILFAGLRCAAPADDMRRAGRTAITGRQSNARGFLIRQPIHHNTCLSR